MAEAFAPDALPGDKRSRYRALAEEVAAVVEDEADVVARMSSVASMLAAAFESFFWTGFYRVDAAKPDELVVGPYQGTLGCLRIAFGQGVCGAAAARRQTLIVPDVEAFEGHIACDSRSRSEIVVPVFAADGSLIAVLDVDSTQFAAFDEADAEGLKAIVDQVFAGAAAHPRAAAAKSGRAAAMLPETAMTHETGSVDPTRTQFDAFKALPRDRPIQMLNLIRLRERADYPPAHPDHGKGLSGRDAYRAYGRAAAGFLERLGARQIWAGRPEVVVTGPAEERWDLAFIVEYPGASAFLAMVTDPQYRQDVAHRTAAVADSRLIRLAPLAPGEGLGE